MNLPRSSIAASAGAFLLPPIGLAFAGPGPLAIVLAFGVGLSLALAGVVAGHRANSRQRPRPALAILGLVVGYLWLLVNVGSILVITVFGGQIQALLRATADWLASDVKSP